MIEIKALESIDAEALKSVITGYTSDSSYVITWNESDEAVNFSLRLVAAEQPFSKRYAHLDADTLELYRAALPHGFCFGAYDAKKLVGVALAEPHDWNGSLWVWEFHVAESFRGQGVGRLLMEKLVEKSRAASLRVIVCETQNTNVPAIRFYRKLGFTLDGIDLCYYTNQDWSEGEVAVFMKRKL